MMAVTIHLSPKPHSTPTLLINQVRTRLYNQPLDAQGRGGCGGFLGSGAEWVVELIEFRLCLKAWADFFLFYNRVFSNHPAICSFGSRPPVPRFLRLFGQDLRRRRPARLLQRLVAVNSISTGK